MGKTRVKICGITSAQDAALAAAAGADALGLIFHPPAARCVSMLVAEQIVASLPPFIMPVGLFLDLPTADITAIARRLHLGCLQLHGHETPADVRALDGFCVIKAIHVKPGELENALRPWREAVAAGLPNLKALVLETHSTAAAGGTGIENDWQQIEDVQRKGGFEKLPPIILAGGLRPSNVRGVIEKLRPYAVDVSSGVEQIKGKKSPERMAEFVQAVHLADGRS